MRTCQSCGRENDDDRDFCVCGEYLRWEPTGFVPAVTPERAAQADAPAEPAPEPLPAEPPPPVAAVPPPPPEPEPEPAQLASVTLRLPGEDDAKGEPLAVGVDAGGRERVLALIRNQSKIVDNYVLSLRGLPESWWTIAPAVAYLVPLGSSGTYEQDIEIHLHPPRSPEAQARLWDVELVAHSKAHGVDAAVVGFVVGIQPYEEIATKVRPERASGRLRARFDVSVANAANAPAVVALSASEPDGDCRFSFDPPQVEVAPGATAQSRMTVRPPGQIWLGRPLERRLEVHSRSGASVTEAPPPEPPEPGNGLLDKLAEHAPKVAAPSARVGPQGIDVREPKLRAPRVRVPSRNLRLDQLKMPSRGPATPAPAGPLLPTQAVFRQKAWLPWWLAIVVPLLAALAGFLFLLAPKNVKVPEVVGQPSAFAAGQTLTEAGLRLAPQVDRQVDAKKKPGTVLQQTPAPGADAKKDSEVSILIAVGDGKVTVPDLKDKTAGDADKVLRAAGLSLGQATPQPLDPKGKIETQIPAAKEIVQKGAPVNVFLAKPAGAKADAGTGKDEGKDAGKGGKAAAAVALPAVAGQTAEGYAQKLGDAGLNPKIVKQFNDAKKGTILKVLPAAGQKAAKGSPVTLFVSAGIPEVAFDDAKNVLIADGTSGKTLATVAKGSQDEENPTFSADAGSIAFTSDGQVFLRVLSRKKAPVPLTEQGEHYTELAWAPTADVNVLALVKREGDTLASAKSSLCFARITGQGTTPRCKPPSPNVLGRKINWSGNGKTLLVWGAAPDGQQFGVIRYRSAKPFSADPADWKSDGFVTDTTRPGQGALDAVPSPDGKQLAVVQLGKNGLPLLFLAKPGDFLLSDPRALGVVACKVAWRPDGKELLVVRADDCLNSTTGNLVRVPVGKPRAQRSVRLEGDNPSYQPLNVE